MDNEKKNSRQVFLPGEEVGGNDQKAGFGAYKSDGKVYASQIGIKSGRSDYVNIIPLKGKYMPKVGDQVIAYVSEMGPTYWLTEINSPYPAPLHVNDTPWKVDFGDTAKYLEVNDAIIAVITNVDEIKHVQISMREHGHRRINSGCVITITPSKVPRVIGKGGSMISLIKNTANCRLFVGQNGRIWIDGQEESVDLAIRAIEMIENGSHTFGLTEKVKEFLETEAKRLFPDEGKAEDVNEEHEEPEAPRTLDNNVQDEPAKDAAETEE